MLRVGYLQNGPILIETCDLYGTVYKGAASAYTVEWIPPKRWRTSTSPLEAPHVYDRL